MVPLDVVVVIGRRSVRRVEVDQAVLLAGEVRDLTRGRSAALTIAEDGPVVVDDPLSEVLAERKPDVASPVVDSGSGRRRW